MKILITLLVIFIITGGFFFITKKTSNINTVNPDTASDMVAPTEQIYAKGDIMIDLSQSTFNWTAKKTIIKDWIDAGSIKPTSGKISISPEGQITSGEVVIDMNTITAVATGSGNGQERLSTHLKSADFFNVASYPTSRIAVHRIADGIAYGDITIKDITKSVEFPITVNTTNEKHVVSGRLELNRTWFNVKYGSKAFFADLADRMIIDDVFVIDFNIITK